MIQLIRKYASGKRVLLFFIVCNVVYVIMVAYTIPKVMEYADGMKLLDMMPGGYDFEYVKTLLTALGTDGRHAYLFQQIPFDLVYPALFALSYCLLFAYVLKKLKTPRIPLFFLCYLPLLGGTADYLENIGIITLLRRFPEISEQMVQLTSTASVIKSSATTLYFVVLLVVLAVVGIQWIKRKK